MKNCKWFAVAVILACMALTAAAPALESGTPRSDHRINTTAAADTHSLYPLQWTVTIEDRLTCEFHWRPGPPETVFVAVPRKPAILTYSEPYPGPLPGMQTIETQILQMDLVNRDRYRLRNNLDIFSTGAGYFDSDPDTTWVDSFFDIYFELEVPDLPGDTLINYDPVRLYCPGNDSWPHYFCKWSMEEGVPPIPLYSKNTGLEMGLLHGWEGEMRPFRGVVVSLEAETSYGSDVLKVEAYDKSVKFTAGFSRARWDDDFGMYFPEEPPISVEFSYRLEGDPGPFTPIGFDEDGHGPQYRTTDPLGAGDGWCQYFEPGSEPFEEHVYEVRVDAFHPWYGPMYDTCFVYIDPTPPIPVFNDIPRDSVGAFAVDSFFDITFRLDDEMAGPGTAWLNVFPLQIDFQRDLTEVDQLGLGTGIDSASCGPAAAASCLKYFADNGYPELDNPGGDESRPDATAEEMARELQDDMGTDAEGTTPAEMVAGIRKYLEGHGQSGWDVNSGEVNDAAGLAEMFREFESDSEDVLVLLQDTTASGDTVGHVVTLGSAHTNYDGDAATPDQSIDFMDPWGGGSQEDNTYPVDDNTDPPTVGGYDVAVGSGGGSWIAGYIKVSPPEGGDGGGGSPPVLGAPARAPWTEVATAVITGNGAVESMGWDTHGFAGGLYLMEITTEDDEGIRCTDIRLAGLLSSPTGGDVPGIKTMLRGSYPNPFNPTTRIEFSLAGRTPVSLVIYDVAGRRVRVLLSKEMRDEGVHIVDWDGRNDRGEKLSSGVYFCRFLAEGQVEARKLIMLR